MAAKVFEPIGKFGLVLAVAGGMVNSALYKVDAGHRAVIFDRFHGVQDIVNVPVITGSKDLQNVNITLRILFQSVASQLPRIYTSIGKNYDEPVLPSITTEILKSVVAQFDAGELIIQRKLVSRHVSDDFTERAVTFGLIPGLQVPDTSDLREGVHRGSRSQTGGSAGSGESQILRGCCWQWAKRYLGGGGGLVSVRAEQMAVLCSS